MVNLLKYNVKEVFCAGDIHGEFNSIIGFIKNHEIRDSLIIFCGDIGLGFNKPEYYKQTLSVIARTCRKYNTKCVFLRGNHDNPSYFDGKKVNIEDGLIVAVPDYTVIETFALDDTERSTPEKTFLLVGGGTSIDRMQRLERERLAAIAYSTYHAGSMEDAMKKYARTQYWPDEEPVFLPEILDEIKSEEIGINYVCGHSSPSFCSPQTKDGIQGWLSIDSSLAEDIDRERDVMTSIYNRIVKDGHPFISWYNGHFHKASIDIVDNHCFYCLDMGRYGKLDVRLIMP